MTALPPKSDIDYFTCPVGHPLPRRSKKGRCTPLECCEGTNSLWKKVRTEVNEGLKKATAYAEETAVLVEQEDRMAAWNKAHPLPPMPVAAAVSKKLSVREYMKQRLEEVAPYMLERRIRMAALMPDSRGEKAAMELLDRAGFTRRPEAEVRYEGPVLIMNMQRENLPWEAQKTMKPGEVTVSVERVKAPDSEVVPSPSSEFSKK